MKLTNTTNRDLGLEPGVVVPAGGSLEISSADLTRCKSSPVVKAWLIGGELVESGAVEATAEKPTKDPTYAVKTRRKPRAQKDR